DHHRPGLRPARPGRSSPHGERGRTRIGGHARTSGALRRARQREPRGHRLDGTGRSRPHPPGRGPVTTGLVVDDQPLQRYGFRMLLDSVPETEVVAEAAHGAEAVRKAAELRPDVVLMDVRMPGMDGIEATRLIVAAGD